MLFSNEKEDDDDFIPNPNYPSNLASIFGGSGNNGNSSLTYTPPKQPKRQSNKTAANAATSSGSSVIIAKTVQAFKMVDGSYHNQGKVGAAVFSSSLGENCIYQLLLYLGKQQHLCSARITRDFRFHIQPKNYCTFHDKQSVIWSILFENTLEIAEFSLQIAVARWRSEISTSSIMIQDLWCPINDKSQPVAAVGDKVEFTHAFTTINSSFEGVEESQSVSVEVEDSGWKQGLLGTHPTLKRVIILQPFMLGDLNPKEVVFSSPVMLKLSVIRVIKAPIKVMHLNKEEHKTYSTLKESPKPQYASSEDTESTPRGSPRPSKADLITRMARMGQALPFKQPAPTPSDSDETEEDQSSSLCTVDHAVPKPRTRFQHSAPLSPAAIAPAVGGTPLHNPPVPATQQPIQWTAAPYMYQMGNMLPTPHMQSPVDLQSQFNMFFSEVRTTNSEIRMGITRLTDKVDALQSKLENSERRRGQETPALEIEHQLNAQLQLVLSALRSETLTSHNTPRNISGAISAPTTSSAEPCQQCADLQKTQTLIAEKVKKLEEENEYLQTSLNAQKEAFQNAKIADKDQMMQIETLRKQLEEEQAMVLKLNQNIDNLQKEKEMQIQNLEKTNSLVMELQQTVQEKQTSINRLEQALKDSEATKLEEVRRNLKEVLDPKVAIGDHVKKILNAIYRLVKVQFKQENMYEAAFIQSVLADTVKAVTLEYLQNGDMLALPVQQHPKSARTTFMSVGQSQSAPSVGSDQARSEGVREYLGSSSEVESKSSSSDQIDVPSVTELSTPQVTSAASLNTESTIIQSNHGEKLDEKDNISSNENQNEPMSENRQRNSSPESGKSKLEGEPNSPSADNLTAEVWRPQPPPPPLFDEEESGDDWLNS